MAWPLNPVAWARRLVAPRTDRREADSPHHVRRFDAATGGRRGPGLGTFGQLNPEVGAALELVRSRARYLAANDPWGTNGLATWTAHLVGSGIRPNAKTLPADQRRDLARAFEAWGGTADLSGITDFWGLQALVATHLVRDGEALIAMTPDDDGLRLQIVPPDQLDTARTTALADGNVIVQGVEFDPRGRRVAYWIFPDAPHSEFAQFTVSERFDAADILHVFRPMSAGQVRGLSWFAPVVLTASELDKLRDALLTGFATSAMFMGFLTDANAAAGEALFETGADGLPSMEPGTLQVLPPGTDVKLTSPQQAKDAPAFVRLNLQAYAAGLGLPEHLLSGDLTGANYSSLRAGLLPFRQRVEQIQYHTLVPQMLAPIWRRWLSLEIASGRLDVTPDLGAEWIMPRHLQVDPAKDIQAVREMLALGLMSRSQAVAELGWSVDDLDAEIAADAAREAALGLTFTQPGGVNVPD